MAQSCLWRAKVSLMSALVLGVVKLSCSTAAPSPLLEALLQSVNATVLNRVAPFVLALLLTRNSLSLLNVEKLSLAWFVQGLKVARTSPRGPTCPPMFFCVTPL